MVAFGLGSIEFSRVFTFFTPGGGGGGFADPLLGISLLRKLFQRGDADWFKEIERNFHFRVLPYEPS